MREAVRSSGAHTRPAPRPRLSARTGRGGNKTFPPRRRHASLCGGTGRAPLHVARGRRGPPGLRGARPIGVRGPSRVTARARFSVSGLGSQTWPLLRIPERTEDPGARLGNGSKACVLTCPRGDAIPMGRPLSPSLLQPLEPFTVPLSL